MTSPALRVTGLVLASLVLLALALFVGPSLGNERGDFVLFELRMPRIAVGALVGGTLALAGACFQTLFANPLATPSTVGTTAGATLGALTALAFDLPGSGSFGATFVAAFVGAALASAAVAAIAASGRAQMSDVLLGGIAITLAAGALATGVQFVSDSRALIAAARWSLGQLQQVGYTGVLVLVPVVVPVWIGLLLLSRALQTFAFGEELAHVPRRPRAAPQAFRARTRLARRRRVRRMVRPHRVRRPHRAAPRPSRRRSRPQAPFAALAHRRCRVPRRLRRRRAQHRPRPRAPGRRRHRRARSADARRSAASSATTVTRRSGLARRTR
jgi:hypothetical protein